jgi:hypothetical protein
MSKGHIHLSLHGSIFTLLIVVPVRVTDVVVLGFLVRRRVVEITTAAAIKMTAITGNLVQHLFVVSVDRIYINLRIFVKTDSD